MEFPAGPVGAIFNADAGRGQGIADGVGPGEVFAAFLGTTIDKIDNSNFKKTHNLFKEVGAATLNHSGRPPKLYQLN
ncbi:MAG: hypothetical protein ACFN0Z_04875 [Parascardovia denticolens]